MFKKVIFILTISAAAFSANAESIKPALPVDKNERQKLVENPSAAKEMRSPVSNGKYNNADWERLTKEQKLQQLEERRVQRLKKSDEKWKKMTADEKIAQYEKRRKKAADMRVKREAKKESPNAAAQPKAMPAKQ